ncbi:hypothetical protein AB0N06_18200 [Streptomyces sp. NPDC051020]|uniref:hypothetical protein n=1 Tax=Streptomyces sp. NPDC051020 TaxID=3155409 RepID=UPI00341F9E4E
MPRRQGTALLIALVAGTAALAAFTAYAGSALFSGAGSQRVGAQPAARPSAAPAHSTGVWVTTWAGAPVAGVADPYPGHNLPRRTIRNVVHTSIGGDAARITLSNLFGTRPLLVDRATVNTRPVSFRGAPSVTVPAGGQVVSDPVVVPVDAYSDLVVTLRTPTAEGLKAMTERAHARGLRVVGATLMPYEGYPSWTPAQDAVRMRVNELIRAGGVFDEVVDFDRAARDPYRPGRLRPAYDCGDHLHLDDAGYLQLGQQVDLRSLHQEAPASDQL